MKRLFLLSMVFGLLPISMMAQDDDMYFGSTKTTTAPTRIKSSTRQTYYCGSNRSVDEYNRRGGSSYEVITPDTGDVITFSPVEGVYPDSVGDYQLTRKMTRWDDYTPTKAYWEGYAQGRSDSWGWHSPWYYSSFYPWYDTWYDPWYSHSWRFGWYDPWYYDFGWGWHYPYYSYYGGYYGGYYPGYYGGRSYVRYAGNGNTGTLARYSDLGRSTNGGRVANYTSSSRFNGARDRAYNSNSGRRTTVGTNTSRSITRSSTRTSIAGGTTYIPSNNSYGSGTPATFQSGNSGGASFSSGGGGNAYGSSRSSGGSFGGTRSSGGGGGGHSGGGRR